MYGACGWRLIFPLFTGSSYFANIQLQPHYIEQTTQFINANILFSAFDAIELFTTQSCPSRELLLRQAEPSTTRCQDAIDMLFHARIMLFIAHNVNTPRNFQLVELTGTIGYYSMLAMTANACELEAAPGAEVLKI